MQALDRDLDEFQNNLDHYHGIILTFIHRLVVLGPILQDVEVEVKYWQEL